MSESESLSEGERLERLEELLNKESDTPLPFTTAVVAVFDIKCPEMEAYLALLEHQESTPRELAEVLDRTRRLMGMRLNALCEKGLATRKERITDRGGTQYEYTAQSLDETVDWMTEEIDKWSAEVSNQLDTIREEWPESGQQETESV